MGKIWKEIKAINEIEIKFVLGSEVLDETAIHAFAKLGHLVVLVAGGLMILQALGFSIAGLLAFGGVGGIAVGFAAQDLLANFKASTYDPDDPELYFNGTIINFFSYLFNYVVIVFVFAQHCFICQFASIMFMIVDYFSLFVHHCSRLVHRVVNSLFHLFGITYHFLISC